MLHELCGEARHDRPVRAELADNSTAKVHIKSIKIHPEAAFIFVVGV